MQFPSLPVSIQRPADNHLIHPDQIQPNNTVLHGDDKPPMNPIPVSDNQSSISVKAQILNPTSVVMEDHPRPINCSNGQMCGNFYALTDHRSGGM